MSNVKKWNWNDKYYTTSELVEISGLPKSTLATRLRNGWDVATAMNTPVKTKLICASAPEQYAKGTVEIMFFETIPGVFQEMQPTLNKVYTAKPYCAGSDKLKAKLYYIITLDNGKPLIVYPGEFEWAGNTAAAA